MSKNKDQRLSSGSDGKAIRDHVRKMLANLATFQKHKRTQGQAHESLRSEGIKVDREEDGS